MNWTEQRQPGEYLVEWGAPAVLAAAIGWATYAVSGAALAGAGATALALVAGAAAMRRAGEPATGIKLSDFALEPVAAEAHGAEAGDELLLDDPLSEVAPDSRVAAMFEAEPETPGALVARIADYLGERSPQARSAEDEMDGPVAGDAGAALHAALANIRASLR